MTDHHFIYAKIEDNDYCLPSRCLLPGDELLIYSSETQDTYFSRVLEVTDKDATQPVGNIITLNTYNIIANNVHCSTHCEGDGGDSWFTFVRFVYLKISSKAPEAALYIHKSSKNLKQVVHGGFSLIKDYISYVW